MNLEIDNVELNISNKPILNGVYLKAETGKVTGLLGRNGSGKSSLLQILFGSLQPKFSLIRIDGKPISKKLYRTGKVGYLPQTNLVPDPLKINYAFKLFQVKWEDFIFQFKEFDHLKFNKARSLSGGERRLLETYLILKSNNEIVLLDEPFSHLAPIYVERIKNLITIEKQTKIIVITDHMYEQVKSIADELYLLRAGNSIYLKQEEELKSYGYLN